MGLCRGIDFDMSYGAESVIMCADAYLHDQTQIKLDKSQ